MREKIICGLDVGSSKVCAVIAGHNPSEPELNIMGAGEQECPGLRHGVVVNIDNTCRAVSAAVEKAESAAQVKVKDVLVNVNGHHIEGHMQQGATKIPRSDREITEDDVERVINAARAVPLSSDKQIIHAIPLDYRVDSQGGVENPVGMEGSHLEVEVLLITGDSAPINNLDKCVTRAGFGIKNPTATILAPAQTVLAGEEKELGCAIVDIGAQTINIAIFVEGRISYIGQVDIGSDYITYDLAYGLRTSFSEAKRIKENCGSAVEDEVLEGDVQYVGVDGHTSRTAETRRINRIIRPRVDDIIEFISNEISKSGCKQLIPGGVILSGGGAQLRGMDRAVASKLEGFQVRTGRPRGLRGKAESVNAPKYATAVGLVEYAVNTNTGFAFQDMAASGRGGFWEKLKTWIEEMF